MTYVGRWAEARRELLPALAAELVALPVDLIVTVGSPATEAVKTATAKIPIVMAFAGDPLGVGLVASLAHPGSNITGFADQAVELSAKRLEMLREVVPRARRVAVLWTERDTAMTLRYRQIDEAGHALGIAVLPYAVRSPEDFDVALSALSRAQPDPTP